MVFKQLIPLILLFVLFHVHIQAQAFEVAPGSISNTLSDSRSVNFLDINNDGFEDIYISNGLAGGQPDLLYINNGDETFTSVTNMDIVDASNPSDGASFADFNNDGHVDGVISSWYGAEDLLYLNDGSATLDYHGNAGIVAGSYAETAAFGDYDNDGWLDLYITNSGGNNKNYLYKNLQDGTFQRITNHVLVNDTKLSRGAVWGDFNNDNITDLFVANENNTANDIFYGQGGGDFVKLAAGSVVTSQQSSMTGSWGDIDNDGDFDLFVGNSGYFVPQQNQLYRNTGSEFETIINDPIVISSKCTYGSAFADFDNDGDLDLFVANGFCNFGKNNQLFENDGTGTFTDASDQLASNLNICSFGAAWGDVNNNGFLDLMIANCKNNDQETQKANTLLLNLGNDNNWLKIRLTGVQSNRNAIGAKVRVKAMINGQVVWQIREIRSQTGYAGQNSLIAHFGLGDATIVDSVVVNWPAGGEQVLENVAIDQKIDIIEAMAVSVQEFNLSEKVRIHIFPNPVSADAESLQFSINSDIASDNVKMSIHDMLGQSIWNTRVSMVIGKNSFFIPVSELGLAAGIYQMSLLIEGDTVSGKFGVVR